MDTDSGSQTFNVLESLTDLANPQPRYQAMISEAPVHCPMDGLALIAGRGAVEAVLKDHSTFSSEGGFLDLGNTRPLIPLSVDPPRHAAFRKILDPLFAPKRMDVLEDDIAARFNRFVDAFIDRGECNFTDELATPYPSAIFLGLMGLPWDQLDTFLRLKDGILRPGGGELIDDEELRRLQRATGQEVYAYFDQILDEKVKDPRDDILTLFLNAEVDGEKLTRHQILDICFLFLIAGLDTVTDSLTCIYAFLAQHAQHRHQLAENPTLIPAAVEELLRWETPVPAVPRISTRDIELDGSAIKAGDSVLVLIGAANVDPNASGDPNEVRFDRESNRHLAFGGGVHRCLGSHLARRELRIALREWHARIPDYELKPGIELQYPQGLRTVENLELVWKE